jgi:hypothetical protein
VESFVQEVIDETKGTGVGNTNAIVATRVGTMKDKDKSKDKRRENEKEEKDMNAKDGTRTEFFNFAEMRWSHVSLSCESQWPSNPGLLNHRCCM